MPAQQQAVIVSSNPKTTVQTLKDQIKHIRLAIKIVTIIGLLSLLSLNVTLFAWGLGKATIYYLYLYLALLISTILLIANVRFAFYLPILFGLVYGILLNQEIGKLFVFDSNNKVLFLVLALPYFTLLSLIPLTISYLTYTLKHKSLFVSLAIILAVCFPTFAIAEHYNKDYLDNIFIDAKINDQGLITFNCKPSFGDTRTFIITTNSSKIADQIRKHGEYFQGSYMLPNTTLKKKYRFSNLKSITITKINNKKIVPELTWITENINGDVSFLKP